jgi:hypothetical protein
MPRNHFGLIAGGVLLTAGALVASTALARGAQTAPPKAGVAKPPNLNGIWQAANEANWDLEGHAALPGPYPQLLGAWGAAPPSLGVVDGGQIPYLPAALAKKKKNFETRLQVDPFNRSLGDPELKCFLPGVPRATYLPYPFQIVQTGANIMIAYEYDNAVRIINMGKATVADADSWMGHSNGRWEGDSLVVEVTGFNGEAWLDRAGNYSTEATRVTERYTKTSPDVLMYEATIEDPQLFSRPWKIKMPLFRRSEPGMQLLEFKCVEFTEELLYGKLRKPPAQ